ncbi:hypothetical protein ACUODJ_61540, partial [Escherichia sp. HC-CC]
LVWAIVLTFISARGYVKTLGVICFADIIMWQELPSSRYIQRWEVQRPVLWQQSKSLPAF